MIWDDMRRYETDEDLCTMEPSSGGYARDLPNGITDSFTSQVGLHWYYCIIMISLLMIDGWWVMVDEWCAENLVRLHILFGGNQWDVANLQLDRNQNRDGPDGRHRDVSWTHRGTILKQIYSYWYDVDNSVRGRLRSGHIPIREVRRQRQRTMPQCHNANGPRAVEHHMIQFIQFIQVVQFIHLWYT